MPRLDRTTILAFPDLATEEVEVPEWGGSVTLRLWSGTQRDAFESEQAKDQNTNLRARIVARSAIDEAGNLLFTTADVEALGRKSGAALDRLVEAIYRINKYTAKDREEIAKNSDPAPSVAS